jgi:DNA-binding NtrC family response regulator
MQTLPYKCDGRTFRRKLRLSRFANNKQSKNPSIHDQGSHRVLVVDDEPDICLLNSELLIDLSYDVDVAEDGIAAWDLLGKNEYALMITDNRMPRMSGVELLQKLHITHRFVPTIMATGTMPDEQVTCQPWFQVVTTLVKPYTLEEFLTAVKRSIRKCSNLHRRPDPYVAYFLRDL